MVLARLFCDALECIMLVHRTDKIFQQDCHDDLVECGERERERDREGVELQGEGERGEVRDARGSE